MVLTQCEKGHYYDSDKFSSCPHCKDGVAATSEDSVTISFGNTFNAAPQASAPQASAPQASAPQYSAPQASAPQTKSTAPTISPRNAAVKLSAAPASAASAPAAPAFQMSDETDTGVTVRFYEKDMSTEPVVGWLVALSGKSKGKSYMLKAGPNFIGRDVSMDVAITDDMSVSRNKHAVVIYDPKSRKFFALPGESRALFYVDDQVVLNNMDISDRQIMTVGETELMLVAFCNDTFAWEDLKEGTDE